MSYTLIETPFLESKQEEKYQPNPLIVACSGGGGHRMGAEAFAAYYKRLHPDCTLEEYAPLSSIPDLESEQSKQIQSGVAWMNASYVSGIVKKVADLLDYPILPSEEELKKEVDLLLETKPRPYLDMLLDVFPAGILSAAIWNYFQKNGKVEELKKLIRLQPMSDESNHKPVFDFFTKKLTTALEKNKPYTKVICTQAMALSALCEAVIFYNELLDKQESKAPRLKIDLYTTDPLTEGAVHFKDPLKALTERRQNQINLYSVALSKNWVDSLFGEQHFAALCSIPPKKNPLVRGGFYDSANGNSNTFDSPVLLTLQGLSPITIEPQEKIAAIMLGSQASTDATHYIDPLLEQGINKVFVFGGRNAAIQNYVTEYKKDFDIEGESVILLPNQDDKAMASLMLRCNILIIRSGGLTIMEQMALNHSPLQTVFIHHADAPLDADLTTGISWEDYNALLLINYLKDQGIVCQKTSPNRIRKDLTYIRVPDEEGNSKWEEYLPVTLHHKSPSNPCFFGVGGESTNYDNAVINTTTIEPQLLPGFY